MSVAGLDSDTALTLWTMYDRVSAESPRAPFWKALPGAHPERSSQAALLSTRSILPLLTGLSSAPSPRAETIATGVTMPLGSALKGLPVAEEARTARPTACPQRPSLS